MGGRISGKSRGASEEERKAEGTTGRLGTGTPS